jgi:hypothetical protein
MSGGQIAALLGAILLLFPGGCFLFFGIVLRPGTAVSAPSLVLLIGVAILALAGLLFWLAFRRRPPPPGAGAGPSAPP